MDEPENNAGLRPPPLRAVPTIHDVAKRAGVSTSTVSRSLTGGSRVSEETRERVRRIADELGFRPSRSAQALRSSRTGTIGLLAPNLENPISYDHLRATIRKAHERGYTVLVGDGQENPEIQDAELARMRDYRVDGVILGRGIVPITQLLVDTILSPLPVEPYIVPGTLEAQLGMRINVYRDTTADAVGATLAYRRLARLGHRRFAIFLFTHASTRTGRGRHFLLEEVLASEGAVAEVHKVAVNEPDECLSQIQRLMAAKDAPTAIISANGRLTPYVLEGLQSSGVRIPADVSFLSFGDSRWHRAYAPPISVIREDYAAVAERTVDRLVQRIGGARLEPDELRQSEFVTRESIGPAPERAMANVRVGLARRSRDIG